MEPKEVSNSLAMRKVAALKKGEFKSEDFVTISFLVGSEDFATEEIHACKLDLMVASEYFQGLLRSPFTPDGPIRMKHVEPEIFRLVVEFTHTCGNLVTEVNDLKQWLKLAAVVDEFLLEELGQLCMEKLEKLINEDNVWTVFSQNHLIKYTSAVCEKLLSLKTEDCLKEPAFLKIDENALAKFLNLEEMNIESEMQLVIACLEFIKGKEDERALFRRCALPHLRLLTLKAQDDLEKLASFLEKDEKMLIFFNNLHIDPLQIKNDYLVNTSLCKVEKSRNSVILAASVKKRLQKCMEFIVPAEFLCYRSEICQSDYRDYQYTWKSRTIVLIVEANNAIAPSDLLHQLCDKFDDNILISSFRMNGDWIINTSAYVEVKNEDGSYIQSMNLEPLKLNEIWDHIRPAIVAAKGRKVQVEVTFSNTCNFADVAAKDKSGPKKSLEVFLQELILRGNKFSLVMPTPSCPHLNKVEPLPVKEIDLSESCRRCRDKEDNWMCLTCYQVLCGRFIHGHMLLHGKQYSHPLVLGFRRLDVWCYKCEKYVEDLLPYGIINAAHLARFGTEKPWTYGGKIKIERLQTKI